eukprot:COSAG05_NODE_292_length_12012_cov_12.968354_5_plen_80_part_00
MLLLPGESYAELATAERDWEEAALAEQQQVPAAVDFNAMPAYHCSAASFSPSLYSCSLCFCPCLSVSPTSCFSLLCVPL